MTLLGPLKLIAWPIINKTVHCKLAKLVHSGLKVWKKVKFRKVVQWFFFGMGFAYLYFYVKSQCSSKFMWHLFTFWMPGPFYWKISLKISIGIVGIGLSQLLLSILYDDLENELPTKAFQVNKYLQKITVFAKKLTHCNCARLKIPSIFVSLESNIIKNPPK